MNIEQKFDDDTLIKLLRQGNEVAFTRIYNQYWQRLFIVAANKLNHDLTLAEELVQDIFLDLWRRRETLDIKTSLAVYLAAAMKYKVIDARRKMSQAKAYTQGMLASGSIVDSPTE